MKFSMKPNVNGKQCVIIDGREFIGNKIEIDGHGNVIVDGVKQEGQLVGDVIVHVSGDVDTISDADRVNVNGNVGSVRTVSGNVSCGAVSGNVSTVSGDVRCGDIGGSVSTVSGDIARR